MNRHSMFLVGFVLVAAAGAEAAEVRSPSNSNWKRRTWVVLTDGLKGQHGATGFQNQLEGFFDELERHGRFCKTARNQSDDDVYDDGHGYKTMAGMTSMLTGVGMSTHGVGANDDQSWLATAQARWYTSYLKQAKSCGLQTAAVGILGLIDEPGDGNYGAIDQECGWNDTASAETYGDVASAHCSLTLRASSVDPTYTLGCANGDVHEDASARRYTQGFMMGCYPYGTTGAGVPTCDSLHDEIDASTSKSQCTRIEDTWVAAGSSENELPDIVVSHMHRVDNTGHDYGWDGLDYDQAVTALDSELEHTLSLLKRRAQYYNEEWLIVVTSDHGGTGTNHGEDWDDRDADSRIIYGVAVIQPNAAAGWSWGPIGAFYSGCVPYDASGNTFPAIDPTLPRNTHAIHLINYWMGLARNGYPTHAQGYEMDKQLDATPDTTLSDAVAQYPLTSASPAYAAGNFIGSDCTYRFTLKITVADVTNAGTDDPVKVRIKFAGHDTAGSEEAGTDGWINLDDTSRNDFERAGVYRFAINANVGGGNPGAVTDVSIQLAGTDGIIIDKVEVLHPGTTSVFLWDKSTNRTIDNSEIYNFEPGGTGHIGGFWAP